MATDGQSLSLGQFMLALQRWWWIPLVTLLLGGAVGYGYAAQQTKMYQASATVTLEALASASPEFNVVSSYEMQSNIDVINSGRTAEIVLDRIGDIGPASASASYGGTANITITGTAQSAEDAARIANAYADEFADIVREADSARNQTAITVIESRMRDLNVKIAALQRGSAEPTQRTDEDIAALRTQVRTYEQQIVNLEDQAAFIAQGRVSTLDPAVAPSGPYAPAPRRSAALGALLGLLIGFGIIVIRQVLDRVIVDAEDFDDASSGLPILGSVPMDKEWGSASDTHLVMLEAPATNQAESYRTLRTALQYVRVDDPIRRLQVTSPDAQDGKTTTAANLAVALALTGRRVLLVDLDLRRPRLHEFFGKSNGAGFTSLVGHPENWNDAIQNVEAVDGLSLLPSGPVPANPAELLESASARELMELLGHRFDIMIVDSPPILGLSDALVISSMVDSTLLVARAGSITRHGLKAAVESLRRVNAPLIGAVVNAVGLSKHLGYGYGYNYGSYYGKSYGSGGAGK